MPEPNFTLLQQCVETSNALADAFAAEVRAMNAGITAGVNDNGAGGTVQQSNICYHRLGDLLTQIKQSHRQARAAALIAQPD